MSWQIGLIQNDVKISKALAKKIYKATSETYEGETSNDLFYSEDDVTYDGRLNFNPDHMEHMDFLAGDHEETIIKLLSDAKVSGDILFGSLDGDDSGSFWGYRWTKGKFTKLTGELVFKPTK